MAPSAAKVVAARAADDRGIKYLCHLSVIPKSAAEIA
jgi:hypothetical protein